MKLGCSNQSKPMSKVRQPISKEKLNETVQPKLDLVFHLITLHIHRVKFLNRKHFLLAEYHK